MYYCHGTTTVLTAPLHQKGRECSGQEHSGGQLAYNQDRIVSGVEPCFFIVLKKIFIIKLLKTD